MLLHPLNFEMITNPPLVEADKPVSDNHKKHGCRQRQRDASFPKYSADAETVKRWRVRGRASPRVSLNGNIWPLTGLNSFYWRRRHATR